MANFIPTAPTALGQLALTIPATSTVTATVADTTVGAPAITGGIAPYTLTLKSGTLPPGRAISGTTISGAYTTSGTYAYVLTVTDVLGRKSDHSVSVTVSGIAAAVTQALSLGDTIAFLGCSVENEPGWRGYTRALLQRINRRVGPQPYFSFSVPGSTPAQFVTTLPNLLATHPNIMVIGDWVNATTPGTPAALSYHTTAVTSYMTQFGAQSQAKEIWLFPTRKPETQTTQSNAYADSVRAWCQTQDGTTVGNARVRFFDFQHDFSTMKDATYDGLHDTTKVFYNLVRDLGTKANTFLPTGRTLPVIGTTPSGNLFSNPNLALTGANGVVSGAGAADVTGVPPTGFTLSKTIAAGSVAVVLSTGAANDFNIKLTGTMSATQSGSITLTAPVNGLTIGKRYNTYVAYELTAGDGISATSQLYDLEAGLLPGGAATGAGYQSGGVGSVDSGTGGHGMNGMGPIPSPIKPSTGVFPVNPYLGVAEDIGEPWLFTQPQAMSVANTALRIIFTPYAGTTVDAWMRIRAIYIVEAPETPQVPFYQPALLTRDDGQALRLSNTIAGVYNISGIFPSASNSSSTITIAQANANGTWNLCPGDWSGKPDSYAGKVELSTDGGNTWSAVVAAFGTASAWTWTATGLVTGNKVRITITATNALGSTSASETVSIT